MEDSRLFTPLKLGPVTLSHRIAMPTMSRRRATEDHVPNALMKEYFLQRASASPPGTLLFSDTNIPAPNLSGLARVPGLWNQTQVAAWRDITDAVHAHGVHMFAQLMAMGRGVEPDTAKREGFVVKAPSAIALTQETMPGSWAPVAMTREEIKQAIADHATAARNAIAAGFDGVEIAADNGFLVDEFLQDVTNQRDDEYGGSVANRSRFAVEVAKAVVDAIGAERTGLRISPFSPFLDMGMEDPVPQFSDLLNRLQGLGLAWIHVIEPRIKGDTLVDGPDEQTLDFVYDIWKGPILIAGGHTPESAKRLVERHADRDVVVAFGRHFVANPDLIFRIKNGVALNKYDRSTFFSATAKGYTDYPLSEEYLAQEKK